MSNLAYQAMQFAMSEHDRIDHKRKYTGDNYWLHLSEVAGIVSTVIQQPVVIATAWLHDWLEDVCEDKQLGIELLYTKFGGAVATGVEELSDLEIGNRAYRKAASRERLSQAPDWIQTIKCADLISNTSSIVTHDKNFAITYLKEKRLLLDVLSKADKRLWNVADEMCKKYCKELEVL
jgi:guanosine-3',5'-bis(diphosphate) 3'-pyrophosphohydrolase